MKTVLITGAAKGIGKEIARQLAARGCHVILTARDPVAGAASAEELGVKFLPLDVSDSASIERAAQDVPRLDVLINNAAILLHEDDGILRLTAEQLMEVMATNTIAPLRLTQAFLPQLRQSVEPRVINVSSGGGQLTDGADGWAPAYCISKTALNGVTCQLATALPKFAVNSVSPGWVRTDMGGSGAPRSVEEGAAGIVWLAMDAPQSLTSQFLRDCEPIPW